MKRQYSAVTLHKTIVDLAKTGAFLISALVAAQGATAATVSMIEVTGSGNRGQIIGYGEGLAVSFNLSSSFSGVEITAPLLCADSCDGQIILMKDELGPSATAAGLIASRALSFATASAPLLSGLSLASGSYYLIVALTGSGNGGLAWTASDPATVKTLPGVSYGFDLRADVLDTAAAFQSDFVAITDPSAMHFLVTSTSDNPTPPSIPLPASAGLLVTGLAGLALSKRKPKSSS